MTKYSHKTYSAKKASCFSIADSGEHQCREHIGAHHQVEDIIPVLVGRQWSGDCRTDGGADRAHAIDDCRNGCHCAGGLGLKSQVSRDGRCDQTIWTINEETCRTIERKLNEHTWIRQSTYRR